MSVKKLLLQERHRKMAKKLGRLLRRRFPCAMCKRPIIPATCMVVGGQRLCFTCETQMPDALPRKRLYVPKSEVEHDTSEQEADDTAAEGTLLPTVAVDEADGLEAGGDCDAASPGDGT